MKKKITFVALIISFMFCNFKAFTQDDNQNNGFDVTNPLDQNSAIGANLGYTRIGDQNFIGMRFRPDIYLGKFGIGLDVPLMFNLSTGKLRTDEFKDGVGLLRMIRFLSWGVKKADPVYIKVGDISGAYLGYGMLVNNYTNSTSYEKRKIGLDFDICVKNFIGIEGIYSDFNSTSFNLLAVRPYVKPFGMSEMPILNTLDVGISYVTDRDQTGALIDNIERTNHFLNSAFSAWGIDMGILLLNDRYMRLSVFTQYAQLLKSNSDFFEQKRIEYINTPELDANKKTMAENYASGSGFGFGTDFKFKFLGNLLRMDIRLERLWYQDYFLPQFFDMSYELNKDGKIFSLITAEKKQGIYGNLGIMVLDKIRVSGGLLLPDNISETNPALIKLDLDASRLVDKIIVQGSYIKGGLTSLSDALKFDQRSLATLRVAYKLNAFMVAGMDYKWTWSAQSDGTFKATNFISPYVGLNINLGQSSSNNNTNSND